MGSQVYKAAALAAARTQGLTAQQVRGLSYVQTVLLCGVKLDSKTGYPPADFVYEVAKIYAAGMLDLEAKEAALEADRLALETQIKKLPAYIESKVTVVDGEIKVETPNTKPADDTAAAEVP